MDLVKSVPSGAADDLDFWEASILSGIMGGALDKESSEAVLPPFTVDEYDAGTACIGRACSIAEEGKPELDRVTSGLWPTGSAALNLDAFSDTGTGDVVMPEGLALIWAGFGGNGLVRAVLIAHFEGIDPALARKEIAGAPAGDIVHGDDDRGTADDISVS
jgi:hypothetical protein